MIGTTRIFRKTEHICGKLKTMNASNTFDEWKRNNSVLTASGFYETSLPQQLALAKQLYDEAYQYGSHPGFVPDDTSPELSLIHI